MIKESHELPIEIVIKSSHKKSFDACDKIPSLLDKENSM